ncbi:MAG: hypothetical protein MJ252_21150 [archaeon]|nr:hypothetical protein [archaeon]
MRKYLTADKFNEVILIKKKLSKLKLKEKSMIIRQINNIHKKEKKILDKKINLRYNVLDVRKKKEKEHLTKQIEKEKEDFEEFQRKEEINFENEFNTNYPNEPSIIPEVIQLKKRIKAFLEIDDLKSAQRLTDELAKIKDERHNEYLKKKEEEYNFAYEKFKNYQMLNRERYFKEIENKIWEYNRNKSREFSNFQKDKSNKYQSLSNAQIGEAMSIKNYIYNRNNKEGYGYINYSNLNA